MSEGVERSGKVARRAIGRPIRSLLGALASGRCPRCCDGRVFHGRFAMHAACPRCGLRFEREPGYFTGAMYVSYALALPLLVLFLFAAGWALPQAGLAGRLAIAVLLFLPFVPVVFRASRIVWIHLDRTFDPG